jgi:hypothetical protein
MISQGIYAEVTLHYKAGAWHAFPWTFPDFASDRYHQYFLSLRKLYHGQLQKGVFQVERKNATDSTDFTDK